ncbi:hypothetical protein FisN_7Hh267 [Fistulifera solaris]|uniref:Tudor domain-containing protein n=1 Tax=Fistulifera solaris TaxID=1519565 RepID=A0A1Z5KSQ9_FISSO|nr:hypothetical protein FisN_7Hh267 [Fistulifera solaris]|eukprot:GAX29135.1 hypothetical protein FisN_7Hh267 [Fistulifera solaris]
MSYGEDVIDQKLLMRFAVENGNYAWFLGRVKAFRHPEHHIRFADGTTRWCHLQTLEKKNELYWFRTVEEHELDDAVGRSVLMQFPIQNKKTAWFEGKVISVSKNGGHLIAYDGGEEHWHDLRECVKREKMQFLGTSVQKPVAVKEEDDTTLSKRKYKSRVDNQSTSKRKSKIKDEVKVTEDWTKGMEQWLKRTGPEKIAHIMKQVRMLASGAGVRCKGWDINRRAFLGTEVNLSSPLPRFLEHAQALQEEFGMDGELELMVPLQQILRYKESLLDSQIETNDMKKVEDNQL